MTRVHEHSYNYIIDIYFSAQYQHDSMADMSKGQLSTNKSTIFSLLQVFIPDVCLHQNANWTKAFLLLKKTIMLKVQLTGSIKAINDY